MSTTVVPAVGQKWRMALGGIHYVIVFMDERFVYVKDARLPKKLLATTAGASPVARSELAAEWKQVGA